MALVVHFFLAEDAVIYEKFKSMKFLIEIYFNFKLKNQIKNLRLYLHLPFLL